MRWELNTIAAASIIGAIFSTALLNAQAQVVNWPVGSGGNGHFYEAVAAPGGITWSNANWSATNHGGYLATITSSSEDAFLFGLVGTDTGFWYREPQSGNWFGPWLGGVQPTGSTEPGGGWKWVTGEPFSYQNWSPYQPNNSGGNENRLQMGGGLTGPVGTWNDVNETNSIFAPSFIIEYESDPYAAYLSINRQSVGVVIVRWLSRANISYSVEWKSDLSLGSWVTLTNMVGDGSFIFVSEPAVESSRFYRVVAEP
jgi:hypothetical protein